MPTVTDDFGVWNQLGIIVPQWNEWVKFPVISNGANSVFRATAIWPNFDEVRGWVWVRSNYGTSSGEIVSQAIRYYPKPEPQILDLPIPKDLFDRSIYLRHIEVKKLLRLRKLGRTPEVNWQMKLEELWG